MHILYVSAYYKPAYVYGGPVNSMSSLCEGMMRAGADVVVYTTNANGRQRITAPLATPVMVDGVSTYYFPLHLGGINFYAPKLPRAVRENIMKFDIIVIDTIWGYPLLPTASACIRNNKPYVIPVRGQFFPWALGRDIKKFLYFKLFAAKYLNKCAAFHCTDASEIREIIKLGLKPTGYLIPNGISFNQFKELPVRGITRNKLGISVDALVIIFVGRLTSIKRPDIALALAVEVEKNIGKETHLILVGPDEDNMSQSLSDQAAAHGFLNRLHILNLIPSNELLPIMRDADLFVMPSEIQENFGMAALEALASGIPILVSKGIPVGKSAEQAGAGRVVSCSKEEFVKAGIEMMTNLEALRRMGEQGRLLAKSQFDIDEIARRVLRQFQSIIDYGEPMLNV